MRSFLLGLRGDLRIAIRPSCALVLVGVLVLAGLLSATMQDTQYLQLRNAEAQVKALGGQDRENRGFLDEQTKDAARIGELQEFSGVLAFSSAVTGLALGVIGLSILASLTLAGEWARGTMALALLGGISQRVVALRRFVALAVLGLALLLSACLGAAAAAIWGEASRPLEAAQEASSTLKPFVGAIALMGLYSALATLAGWITRDGFQTLLFVCAIAAGVALTTPIGVPFPGTWVPSALELESLLELEVGYIWIWPELSFGTPPDSPQRQIETIGWIPAIGLLLAVTGVLLAALRSQADRSDFELRS